MVWAGWAVTGQGVSRSVGLRLGNSTIDALDDEMGSLAAALGPELEFHVQVTPRATVRGTNDILFLLNFFIEYFLEFIFI